MQRESQTRYRVIIVMGVAGSGKSTVGRAAAARLGWRFHDADELHTPEAIDRMRHGIPLDDRTRQPWLARVRRVVEETLRNGEHAVIACSALKETYRRTITEGLSSVRFVFLAADTAVLEERLRNRRDHFAGPRLLESQLSTLEPPRHALRLNAERPVDELVGAIEKDASPTTRL